MGRSRLAPVLLAIWVCSAGIARASESPRRSAGCGPPGKFWEAAAVFSARAIAIDRVRDEARPFADRRRVRFRIVERFTGDVPRAGEAIVYTPAPAAQGYRFVAGQDYLVYAARRDGLLTVTARSRTAPLAQAGADLAYARAAAAGLAPPGRIVGSVRLAPGEQGPRGKPLARVPISVDANAATVETATDSLGRFVVEVPSAGTYLVKASVPATHYTVHASRSVTLPDPRACAHVEIDVRFNGRVAGRVIDASGKPVAGVTVAHVAAEAAGARGPRRTLTRGDGTYEIDRVPPGPFVIGIELPGAGEHADGYAAARDGILEGGEQRVLDPLVLPGDARIAHLEGFVYRGDGAPAPGARVFLKGPGEDGHLLGAPAVADAGGRFLIALVHGERYHVFAEQMSPTGSSAAPEFSDSVEVSAAPVLPPLRLTVRRRF